MIFDPAQAEDIAGDLLFRTGQAMLSGDFDAMRRCFALPQLMQTQDGMRFVRDLDEFRAVFDGVCGYFRENDVRDLVRDIVAADFIDNDTIGSTHVASLIGKDRRKVGKPFPVYSVIRRQGSTWRIAISHYVLLDAPELSRVIAPTPISTPDPHENGRSDKSKDGA